MATPQEYAEGYERWLQRVLQMHAEFEVVAGVHLKTELPFDLLAHAGDPSLREIPGDVRAAELTASHSHYDTTDANRDINCVFPIDALRELAKAGVIAAAAPRHFGLMGFIPRPAPLIADTAPRIAAALRAVAGLRS